MMRPEATTTPAVPTRDDLCDQAVSALGRLSVDRIMFADDPDGALAITYDRAGLVYVTAWYDADNDPFGWGGTASLSRVEASTARRLTACEGHYTALGDALKAHIEMIDALVVEPDYALARLTATLADLPRKWAERNDTRPVRTIGGEDE